MTNQRAMRVGPLDTVAAIRREAGRLYKAARRGEIDVADASRLTPLLRLLFDAVAAADLEDRVAALEDQKGKRND